MVYNDLNSWNHANIFPSARLRDPQVADGLYVRLQEGALQARLPQGAEERGQRLLHDAADIAQHFARRGRETEGEEVQLEGGAGGGQGAAVASPLRGGRRCWGRVDLGVGFQVSLVYWKLTYWTF